MPDPDPSRRFPWMGPSHAPARPRDTLTGDTLTRDTLTRDTLTREQIVDAAVRVLDHDGLEALSMRRLGAELGAGATSLYWHVRSKDELLDLVVDRIIGEVAAGIGEPAGWRGWMTAVATSLRAVLVRHRGAAAIVGVRPTFGPNALRALEGLLRALVDDGFGPEPALLAATTLVTWASGFAVFEVRDPLGATATDADRAAFSAALVAYMAGLPADAFPTTLTLLPASAAITMDRQFAFGLAALLDGIDAQAGRARRAGGR